MGTIVQKLLPEERSSITCRLFETPDWETPWHRHHEIELCMILRGSGKLFSEKNFEDFNQGDIFFIGGDVPHFFEKSYERMVCSALIIHFSKESFGSFFELIEMSSLDRLTASSLVLKLEEEMKNRTGFLLRQLVNKSPAERILDLLQCLYWIARTIPAKVIPIHCPNFRSESNDDIQQAYNYAMNHFKESIKLDDLAEMTHQSVSSFCKKFKKLTNMTFSQFLIEIRLQHACKLLLETDKNISEICFESGFRNWSNFSNHFKRIKKMAPSEYRNRVLV